MKRLVIIFSALCAVVLMTSCVRSTPSKVTQSYAEYIVEKDYNSAVDLYLFPGETPEEIEKGRQRMKAIFENFLIPEFDRNGGVVSYTIGEETIDDNENTAVVELILRFENNKIFDRHSRLIRVNGVWHLDTQR